MCSCFKFYFTGLISSMIFFSLISVLPTNTPTWLTYFDETALYEISANDLSILHPTKGWGQFPGRNDVKTADVFERVRIYINKIRYANSSEMKTDDFNDSALEMIWVS